MLLDYFQVNDWLTQNTVYMCVKICMIYSPSLSTSSQFLRVSFSFSEGLRTEDVVH